MIFFKEKESESSLTFELYLGKVKDSSKYDMMIYGSEYEDKVMFALEYYSAIFKKETMKQFGERFVTLLENITDNSDQTVSEITCFPESEKIKSL